MRIDRIALKDFPPIRALEINTTSNVVIIAGANGCGKTRLKQAIVSSFREPTQPKVSLLLSATRDEEEKAWEARTTEVSAGSKASVLAAYLSTRSRQQAYTGTVIQIDSDRAVRPVKFEKLGLSTEDPDDQDVNYSWYLNSFVDRWQELVNKIYKKAANRDHKIAKFVKENLTKTCTDAIASHPDPFLPYQDVFALLLPGKKLQSIDPKSPKEFHYQVSNSGPMPFNSLSSGEQEVIKVAFDLVWKKITHSVILIDEPELHLHPTLAFRLVETLKGLGGGTNQIFLFTHSADLISTYYSTGNVFFIDSASGQQNQAHQLSDLATAHAAVAQAAGANLGLFAVGKRLVFVEGKDASIDRLVYHGVVQKVFPDAYVLPIGSVENIIALRAVISELGNAIFGINLFMIRDRDGLSDDAIAMLETNPRFRCLPRRHVENYLLDAEVLSKVATAFYLPTEKRDVNRIQTTLKEIAETSLMHGVLLNCRDQIRFLSAVAQPSVRDVERMSPEDLGKVMYQQISESVGVITKNLAEEELRKLVVSEHNRLKSSLQSDEWMKLLPGKPIFNRFCGAFFGVETTRVREAYTDVAVKGKPTVFKDIEQIMLSFAGVTGTNPL